MTDTLVGRLRFDAARCELQFSKGVAANIEEAAAEIERLREDVARIKIQRNNALLDMEEFMNKAAAAESSLSEAVKALDNADAALGEATAILGGEYGDHYATLCDRMLQLADDISAIRSRAAVLDSDKM